MAEKAALEAVVDAIEADDIDLIVRNVEQGKRLEVQHPEDLTPEQSDAIATLKGEYGRMLESVADGDLSAAVDVPDEVWPAFRKIAVEAAEVHPDVLESRRESAEGSS